MTFNRMRMIRLRLGLRSALIVLGVICIAAAAISTRWKQGQRDVSIARSLGPYCITKSATSWLFESLGLGAVYVVTGLDISKSNGRDALEKSVALKNLRVLYAAAGDMYDTHRNKPQADCPQPMGVWHWPSNMTPALKSPALLGPHSLESGTSPDERQARFSSRTTMQASDVVVLEHFLELEALVLRGQPLTDEAIESLASLENLRYLDVRDTEITTAGIEKLRNALPNTTILY